MSLNRTIIQAALIVVMLGGCKIENAAKVDYNRTGQSAGAACKATYDCEYPCVCADGTCKKVGFEKEAVPPIEEPPSDVVWWPDVNDIYDDGSSCCSPWDPCDWGNDGYCDCPGQDWDWSDCNGFEDVGWVDVYSPDFGGPDWIMVDLSEDDSGGCCLPWDPCGWADDGWCDCPGEGWDDDDCYGEPDIVEDFGCEPDCWGKECGADGCGNACGHCSSGYSCTAWGECSTASGPCETGDFASDAQKLVYQAIGKGGYPGEALDLDNDWDTCSPVDDCVAGMDNQLSGLLAQLSQFVDYDAELANAMEEGTIVKVIEMDGFNTYGEDFTLNLYYAEPVYGKNTCDYQTELCPYLVTGAPGMGEECTVLASFDNARVEDGVLEAGGPGHEMLVSSMLFGGGGGPALPIVGRMVTVIGIVEEYGWDDVQLVEGIVGYAVVKAEMMATIDAMPPDVWEEMPVSKDMVKNLLDMFISPDMDTNDDGQPDAASVGIKIATIPAEIAGIF